MNRGIFPGVEYRVLEVTTSTESGSERSLPSARDAPEGAFENGDLTFTMRPVYPLVARLEREWPVRVPAREFPVMLTPFAYNAATAWASLTTSLSVLVVCFVTSQALTLSVIPSRSMEPTLQVGKGWRGWGRNICIGGRGSSTKFSSPLKHRTRQRRGLTVICVLVAATMFLIPAVLCPEPPQNTTILEHILYRAKRHRRRSKRGRSLPLPLSPVPLYPLPHPPPSTNDRARAPTQKPMLFCSVSTRSLLLDCARPRTSSLETKQWIK